MAKLIVNVRDCNFAPGDELAVEIEARHATGATQVTTINVANAPVTSGNFVSGLKTRVMTFAQTQYGITLLANEILVFGAPQ